MKNFAVKYDNLETKVGRYLQQKHMPLFNNLVGQSRSDFKISLSRNSPVEKNNSIFSSGTWLLYSYGQFYGAFWK